MEAVVVAHLRGGFNQEKIIEKFQAPFWAWEDILLSHECGQAEKTCPCLSPRQENRTFVSHKLGVLS